MPRSGSTGRSAPLSSARWSPTTTNAPSTSTKNRINDLDDRVEDERMALPFHDPSSFGVGTSMLGSLGHRARGSPWPTHWSAALFRAEGRHGYLPKQDQNPIRVASHGR